MKQIVDLTASFGPGKVSLVPGHPPVEYEMIHTHEKNHRTNAWISFSIHVGTHIDPPYHFKPTGKTIDELPLHFFIGKAHVAHLRGKLSPGEGIGIAQIEGCGITQQMLHDCFLIIDTGWCERYGTDAYYEEGYHLDPAMCQWLADAGLRGVVLDCPPDPSATEDAFDGTESPAHRTLLSNDVVIIENCENFSSLTQDTVELYAIPLKIHRGCGGPARVFAIQDV